MMNGLSGTVVYFPARSHHPERARLTNRQSGTVAEIYGSGAAEVAAI